MRFTLGIWNTSNPAFMVMDKVGKPIFGNTTLLKQELKHTRESLKLIKYYIRGGSFPFYGKNEDIPELYGAVSSKEDLSRATETEKYLEDKIFEILKFL